MKEICRITSLKGFDGVLVGRDLGGILKEGHVYSCQREIILTDLGEHANEKGLINEKGVPVSFLESYLKSGATKLTKKEYEYQLKSKQC